MSDTWNETSLGALKQGLLESQDRIVASHDEFLDALGRVQRGLGDLARRLDEERSNLSHRREDVAASLTQLEVYLGQVSAQAGNQEVVERLETELRAARDEIASLEDRLRGEGEAAVAARQRIVDLEAQLSERTSALQEATRHAESAAADLDAARARLEQAEAEVEGLRGRVSAGDESAERVRTLEQQVETGQKRIRRLEARLSELQHVANALIRATSSDEDTLAEAEKATMAISEPAEEEEEEPEPPQETAERFEGAKPAMPPMIEEPLLDPAQGRKRSLGEILCQAGAVTRDQLELALAEQRRTPQAHLGQILVRTGVTDEMVVARALAVQGGFEFLRLDYETIDPVAAGMITQRLAQQHCCIPIRVYDERIVVAMSNPLDLVAIEDVERATNLSVDVMVSVPDDIRGAIERLYWEPE